MTIEQRERYEATMRNELDISLEKRYVKEEAFKEGKAEGLEQGRAEGKADALLETARKMQTAGADPAYIKALTGIDL